MKRLLDSENIVTRVRNACLRLTTSQVRQLSTGNWQVLSGVHPTTVEEIQSIMEDRNNLEYFRDEYRRTRTFVDTLTYIDKLKLLAGILPAAMEHEGRRWTEGKRERAMLSLSGAETRSLVDIIELAQDQVLDDYDPTAVIHAVGGDKAKIRAAIRAPLVHLLVGGVTGKAPTPAQTVLRSADEVKAMRRDLMKMRRELAMCRLEKEIHLMGLSEQGLADAVLDLGDGEATPAVYERIIVMLRSLGDVASRPNVEWLDVCRDVAIATANHFNKVAARGDKPVKSFMMSATTSVSVTDASLLTPVQPLAPFPIMPTGFKTSVVADGAYLPPPMVTAMPVTGPVTSPVPIVSPPLSSTRYTMNDYLLSMGRGSGVAPPPVAEVPLSADIPIPPPPPNPPPFVDLTKVAPFKSSTPRKMIASAAHDLDVEAESPDDPRCITTKYRKSICPDGTVIERGVKLIYDINAVSATAKQYTRNQTFGCSRLPGHSEFIEWHVRRARKLPVQVTYAQFVEIACCVRFIAGSDVTTEFMVLCTMGSPMSGVIGGEAKPLTFGKTKKAKNAQDGRKDSRSNAIKNWALPVCPNEIRLFQFKNPANPPSDYSPIILTNSYAKSVYLYVAIAKEDKKGLQCRVTAGQPYATDAPSFELETRVERIIGFNPLIIRAQHLPPIDPKEWTVFRLMYAVIRGVTVWCTIYEPDWTGMISFVRLPTPDGDTAKDVFVESSQLTVKDKRL
jgi:hypothetical protein